MRQRGILSKIFLAVAIVSLMAVSSVVLLACGGPKVTIAWDVSHATVEAYGYDAPPTEVGKGTEIDFKVTPDTGYKVTSVKQGGTILRADSDGYYLLTVEDNTTVTVATERVVSLVAVTTDPTNLTYYSGESLDRTGMEVKVTYGNGDVESLDVDSPYLTITPVTFQGGDDSFTATFGGKTSAPVELDAVVENLVVLDLDGGSISAEALALLSVQNNYSYENGVIRFTHLNNLGTGLVLPVADDMFLEDFTFKFWRDSTMTVNPTAHLKILNTSESLYLKADWEANLVKVKSVELENRVEDEVTVSYLIIKGTFIAAESAYLYLYEGNDEIEFVGDTVTGTIGEDFELLFDLRTIYMAVPESDEFDTYEGKWMDIRFKAMVGEREGEMQIYMDDPDLTAMPGSCVLNKEEDVNISYNLRTHISSTSETLKVLYQTFKHYTYDVTLREEANDLYLEFSGHILDEEFWGKYVHIYYAYSVDWSDNLVGSGLIDATDGSWTITGHNIAALAHDTTSYLKIYITEASDGSGEKLYNGGDMLSANSETGFAWVHHEFPIEKDYGYLDMAVFHKMPNGMAFYVGHVWNGQLIVYVRDEAILFNPYALEEIDGKACLVLSGIFQGEGAKDYRIDFQRGNDWARPTPAVPPEVPVFNDDDGTWKYVIELTHLEAHANAYFIHFDISSKVGADGASNLPTMSITDSITVNGITYSLDGNYNMGGWEAVAISITIAE